MRQAETLDGRDAGPRTADAVDPLDLLAVLGRYKRMLVAWPLAAAAVAAGLSLVWPATFTGRTTILPPQGSQSAAAAMLSQLGGEGSVGASPLALKNPSDLHVAILRSNAVADALIERFELRKLYETRYLADCRKALADRTRVSAEKSGVVAVEVDARDPRLAADLANAYVEELHRVTSGLAVTEAAQRRVFFGRQLELTREKLADAEVRLREAIRSGGIVSVDAQSKAAVETIARLRAEVSAKEIQIGAMRAYASRSHPDVRRAEQELASVRRELARLESGTGTPEAPERDGAGGQAGESGVGNIQLLREVKFQEVMLEFLAKQYELAQVEESKEAPLVQVLDRAAPPEKRSSPKRTRMVLLGGAGAFLLAVVAAFTRDALAAARADPSRRKKLAALGEAWRIRRGP